VPDVDPDNIHGAWPKEKFGLVFNRKAKA
jgi:hypothetical protein